MKKININFDIKSIKKAIDELNSIQGKVRNGLEKAYIENSLDWIKDRANTYLEAIDIDGEVKADIQNSWNKNVEGNVGKLVNLSNKSAFIEFGVGIVGQSSPHPNANNQPTGNIYEYNVDTGYKREDGHWTFNVDNETGSIDLVKGYYQEKKSERGKEYISTKGSPANLYLYNAAMDFISTGAYKSVWQQTLDKLL